MPPLSSFSSSQLSYEGPSMMYCSLNDNASKPALHLDNDDETSRFLTHSSMEVKPCVRLWSENSSVWSLPMPAAQQPKKRAVHFARTNTVHEIIHVSEYTLEELENGWYSRLERKQMIANRNACVARLDAWLDLLPQDDAMEGLEKTCETRRAMAHIHQAIHAVLSEQYDQRIYGMIDPDYIALRYKAVVDSYPKNDQQRQQQQQEIMPNPVGMMTLTEQQHSAVRYHEVAPMA
ncbi:unnamed protein product [Cylindrotheca closterium]|uniref:Uncharacterized protein n=1 Tax=Cylindrotheca closterium TaxID=2856 RepID=A0AAD2G8I4_9STRA|nr:unnamed protein product [Cylindrotheca closterium]